MNETCGSAALTSAPQVQQECARDMQAPMPVAPRNQCRDASIRKVANGFILQVGCQTFVSRTWEEASVGLAEYWKDPVAAERKYCAAQ